MKRLFSETRSYSGNRTIWETSSMGLSSSNPTTAGAWATSAVVEPPAHPPAQLTLPEELINLVASFARTIPDPKEFAYPINEDVSVIIEPEFFYDSKGNLMGFLYVSRIEGGHRTFTWLLSMTAHAARHEYEFMCEYEGVEPNTAELEEYFDQLKSNF